MSCPTLSPESSASPSTPSPDAPPSPDTPPFQGPPPDPTADPDLLEELGDRIARLAAQIHAAEQRFLLMLAEFDWRRGWELDGHRSCAEWLSLRTGFDAGTCREKVRTARKLARLPETSAAMGRGELSFSQVRALTRVATPDNEGELLDLARGVPTRKLEELVRGWRRGTREEEVDGEQRRFASRKLSVFPDEEGMYVVRGRLPAEVGLLLVRAIDAAGDHLYREEVKVNGWDVREPEVREREAAERRADALGLLAERAMGAGFGGSPDGEGRDGERGLDGHGADGDGTSGDDAAGDGANAPARPSTVPISGLQAERYQVVLHVEPAALAVAAGEAEPAACCHLDDGTRVSAETARRLSCDAGLVRMTHDEEGHPLTVGRRTRTIPVAIRRALETRDRGCRFPGCLVRSFTVPHHVKHWAWGGETSLDNLVLLCRHHHRLVHEGGWRVQWWGRGRPLFLDPRGGAHFDGRWTMPPLPAAEAEKRENAEKAEKPENAEKPEKPEKPENAEKAEGREEAREEAAEASDPVERLMADNLRVNGARPDGWTASARWEREQDIPPQVYFPAIEAIGEALA